MAKAKNKTTKDEAPESYEEINKLTLPYHFTQDELLKMGNEQSLAIQKIGELKAEKKSLSKEKDSEISEQEAILNSLANKINTGKENRLIDCRIIYHSPKEGEKTIIRMDTNEKVEVTEMSNEDYRLQFSDEELEKLETNNLELVPGESQEEKK